MTTHPCLVPGCAALLTRGARCATHAVDVEQGRPNYAVRRWYRTRPWATLRAVVLREQAYQCAACGRVTPTLDIDHVTRHDGDPDRFWDRANLQALCRPCHTRKTTRGQ